MEIHRGARSLAALALFVPSIALGCGGPAPPAYEPPHRETIVRPDARPSELLPAWRACQRLAPAPGSPDFNPCLSVNASLRRARRARSRDLYDAAFVVPLTLSCKAAAKAVERLVEVMGPLQSRDGVTLPTWTELGEPKYAGVEEKEGLDAHFALTHAVTLVRCRDGASLATFLEAYRVELDVPRAPAAAPTALATCAARLVASAPRDALAMVDGGPAPPALAAAVERAPRPRPCPATAAEVTAAMRDPSPAERVHGCGCVGELPSGAPRREADAVRQELIRSDPLHETSGGGGAADAPRDIPGAFAPILLVPLALRSLGSGNPVEKYPVRDTCWAMRPPDDAPTAVGR